MTARAYCATTIDLLSNSPKETWAQTFIQRRMEFHRFYSNGLVVSTSHGADFFANVIACLDGAEWDEKGEFGNNFRQLIKNHVGS